MQPVGTPTKHRTDDTQANRKERSPPRTKDRVYVQFADDLRDNPEQHLKYTDESSAYSTLNTRGHFTANPLSSGYVDGLGSARPHDKAVNQGKYQGNGQHDGHATEPGRTYDFFSPEKRQGQRLRNDMEYDRVLDPAPYERSPTYGGQVARQRSPQQTQGLIHDRIGKQYSDDLVRSSSPTREFGGDVTSSSRMVLSVTTTVSYKIN